MSPPPVLVVNPRVDQTFVDLANHLVESGIRIASDLEAELQKTHSIALVRPRSLSGERIEVWYVYREGSWVGSSPLETDIQANSESLVADAQIVARIEAEAKQQPAQRPRAMELAKQTEELVGRMSHTARMQTQLVKEVQSKPNDLE